MVIFLHAPDLTTLNKGTSQRMVVQLPAIKGSAAIKRVSVGGRPGYRNTRTGKTFTYMTHDARSRKGARTKALKSS